jgi:hypothetical protein
MAISPLSGGTNGYTPDSSQQGPGATAAQVSKNFYDQLDSHDDEDEDSDGDGDGGD